MLVNGDGLGLLEMFSGGGNISLLEMIELPLFEIGGSIVVGVAFGLFSNGIMHAVTLFHAEECH